jgi:hypothetical protein
MQVRRELAQEPLLAVPFDSSFLQCRTNDIARERIEVQRLARFAGEYQSSNPRRSFSWPAS